jgi:hypothetical protein
MARISSYAASFAASEAASASKVAVLAEQLECYDCLWLMVFSAPL